MTSVVHYVSLLLPDFIIILISCIAEHESRLYTVHALLICMYEKKKKKKIKELTLKSFIHNLFFYMMNTSYLQTFSSLSFSFSFSSLLWLLQPVWCPHSSSQRGGVSQETWVYWSLHIQNYIKKNSLFLPLRNQTQNQIKHNFKNS